MGLIFGLALIFFVCGIPVVGHLLITITHMLKKKNKEKQTIFKIVCNSAFLVYCIVLVIGSWMLMIDILNY